MQALLTDGLYPSTLFCLSGEYGGSGHLLSMGTPTPTNMENQQQEEQQEQQQ